MSFLIVKNIKSSNKYNILFFFRPVYFGHFSDKIKLLKMRFSFIFLSILTVTIGQQDISCAQCIEFLTESGENFGSDVGK